MVGYRREVVQEWRRGCFMRHLGSGWWVLAVGELQLLRWGQWKVPLGFASLANDPARS